MQRWDNTTPIEATLRAVDDLVRMGKMLYLGVSEYASWQLAHANLLAELRGWTPCVVLQQSEYHMFARQVEHWERIEENANACSAANPAR